jgi:hypothetical protein
LPPSVVSAYGGKLLRARCILGRRTEGFCVGESTTVGRSVCSHAHFGIQAFRRPGVQVRTATAGTRTRPKNYGGRGRSCSSRVSSAAPPRAGIVWGLPREAAGSRGNSLVQHGSGARSSSGRGGVRVCPSSFSGRVRVPAVGRPSRDANGAATPGLRDTATFAESRATTGGRLDHAIMRDGRCPPLNSFPVQ